MQYSDIVSALELSSIAYSNDQPRFSGEHLEIINDKETDVQCYIRRIGAILTITFRGSNSAKDWRTNFKFSKKTIPYENKSSRIRVHSGFINAYKAHGIRDVLHGFVTSQIERVRVTGHSQGAALAILCAVDLQYNFPDRDYEVYLFGSPRVGNTAFKKSYNNRVFKTLRVENGNDIVTKVPLILMGYRHVGIPVHIGKPRIFGVVSANDHRQQQYYSSLLKSFRQK